MLDTISENRNLVPSVQGKEKKEGRPAGRAEQSREKGPPVRGSVPNGIQRVVMREKITNTRQSMKEITDENFELSRVEREQKQSN
jgi:hypothetical protein